jgi:Trypsin-co-occurring domain 2
MSSKTSTPPDSDLPLAEDVAALRREIAQAMDDAQGETVIFELGPVTLELLVEVKRTRSFSIRNIGQTRLRRPTVGPRLKWRQRLHRIE